MYPNKHKLIIVTNRRLVTPELDLVGQIEKLLTLWAFYKRIQVPNDSQGHRGQPYFQGLQQNLQEVGRNISWLTQANEIKILLREPDLLESDFRKLIDGLTRVTLPFKKVELVVNANPLFYKDLWGKYKFHVPLRYVEAWEYFRDNINMPIIGTSIHNTQDYEFVKVHLPKLKSASLIKSNCMLEYVLVSPVFPTSCKPGAISLGLEGVRKLPKFSGVDYYALGGIHEENYNSVFASKVVQLVGIAVMSEAMSVSFT